MKAMLLAAGKGARMRPLTETTPKPLLSAGGCSLIEHQIRRLAAAGFRDLVINHAWLGQQLEDSLADGASLGVRIRWSPEGEPLETAGGIARALPLLGADPFVVANADIWTDYSYARLRGRLQPGDLVHLVLVPNPDHHPGGDFSLDAAGRLRPADAGAAYTYSGIAVFAPELFRDLPAPRYPLLPLLQQAIAEGRASAELHGGGWMDIGTPERLATLDAMLAGLGKAGWPHS